MNIPRSSVAAPLTRSVLPSSKGHTYEGEFDRKSDSPSNSIKHEDKFSKKEDHDDK